MAIESKRAGKIKTQITKGFGSKGQRSIRMRGKCGFQYIAGISTGGMSNNG